ncbi:BolA family protein [Gluconacetobacter diazotrophicus]|uniref:BolA family protein n=1 Tax=Gluconacetobacter diazotrophicus TaxID=33996 RepID=UPI000173CA62|nr:BolA protein [Gluconacetobacter diazotrophicus]
MSDTERNRATRIGQALHARLTPAILEIEDDSARHAGHAGARHAGRGPETTGETHYNILLVSGAFGGISRVQRSRLVHDLLADEFASGLHALSLTLRTPDEHAALAAGTAGA